VQRIKGLSDAITAGGAGAEEEDDDEAGGGGGGGGGGKIDESAEDAKEARKEQKLRRESLKKIRTLQAQWRYSDSDLLTAMCLIGACEGSPSREDFCKDHCLSFKAMTEACALREQLETIVSSSLPKPPVPDGTANAEGGGGGEEGATAADAAKAHAKRVADEVKNALKSPPSALQEVTLRQIVTMCFGDQVTALSLSLLCPPLCLPSTLTLLLTGGYPVC
jgi:hypothetical protein